MYMYTDTKKKRREERYNKGVSWVLNEEGSENISSFFAFVIQTHVVVVVATELLLLLNIIYVSMNEEGLGWWWW